MGTGLSGNGLQADHSGTTSPSAAQQTALDAIEQVIRWLALKPTTSAPGLRRLQLSPATFCAGTAQELVTAGHEITVLTKKLRHIPAAPPASFAAPLRTHTQHRAPATVRCQAVPA